MQKHRSHTRTLRRLALAALMLAFAAEPGVAKEWEMVNTPPPMPPAMQRQNTGTGDILTAVPTDGEHTARVNGGDVTLRTWQNDDVGFAVPDASGGFVRIPAQRHGTASGFADARELKLKAREMADQLIAGMDGSLRGVVALPTSFVNQEDFSQSSPLGRFMAEQMLYEFNQRGFPVREYRLADAITVKEGQGEFLLSRRVGSVSARSANTVFVVGTFFQDRNAVFINARLVRGNGEVLRTAQVMLPGSAMTRRMLAGAGKTLPKGSLPIQDFKTTTQPTNLTPFDLGADVH